MYSFVLNVCDMAVNSKRITLKRTRPNPLFQEWLQELQDEARLKRNKLEHSLGEAVSSLSKYPLTLQTGAECAILKGFDSKLCSFLDKRLEEYTSLNKFNNNSCKVTTTIKPDLVSISAVSFTQSKDIPIAKDILEETSEIIFLSKPINDGFCETIDLSQHEIQVLELPFQNNIAEVPKKDCSSKSIQTNLDSSPILRTESRRGRKKKLKYKPIYKSGSYAILMGLWEHSSLNSKQGINKKDLLKLAHKHSEDAMKEATEATHHFLWANISNLMSKGLVEKKYGDNTIYKLTTLGCKTAKVLYEEFKDRQIAKGTQPDEENDGSKNNVPTHTRNGIEACNTDVEIFEMEAGSYDIILIIDVNESIGLYKTNDPIMIQIKKYPNLKHEYRCLSIGDFTWIARNRINKEELVLPYIIERKRLDDLASSIKDGRFHEQKFRLKKCGAKVIYMVENYNNKYVGLPIQTLMQGLVNTRIQDGFKVHVTDSLVGSVRLLAILTMQLLKQYQDSSLKGHNKMAEGDMLMTYEYFNKAFMKNKPLSVRYTFIKLLLQLKGLSVERAVAITSKFKTPKSLIEAYDKCDQKEGEMLLANIKCENNRKVGPHVSKTVYRLFTKRDLL